MLKAVVLFEYPSLNGGEYSFLSMVPLLRAAGIQLTAVGPPQGDLAERLAFEGILLESFQPLDSGGVRKPLETLRDELADRLKSLQPDLIHANSLSISRVAGPVAKELNIPIIGHLRDILRLSRQATADLDCCDRILAVSQATADWHVAAGLSAERTQVQYNGIDLEAFRSRSMDDAADVVLSLREELNIPTETLLIATVGQLGLRKGTEMVLESATHLAAEFANVHWLIIGERHSRKQESIEFESELHRLAEDAPLRGRVHFLGRRNDLPEVLRQVDVLVHAARQEPLGRVLLEAAASGLAIVATDVGGTAEIFPDPTQAILVSSLSGEAITTSLRPVLSDSSLRKRLGAFARQRAETFFDVKQRGRELAEHYVSTLAMHHNNTPQG